MSGSSSLDLAALATSGVVGVEELLRAIEASHKHTDHSAKHLGHAAVSAIVAVGALELLRRDEMAGKDGTNRVLFKGEHHNYHSHDGKVDLKKEQDVEPSGYKRRIAEEILGAYSLGEEVLGHKKHHVAHAVAEVLGAIAAAKNTRDHVNGMEK